MKLDKATPFDQPPAHEEFELSLFGPGFGECIALHIGAGKWVVVDSCLAQDRGPAALEYFKAIKVNPATAVTHIIISHADNDHIGGAADLFAACSSAELVYSAAFAERDMVAWIAAYSELDPSEMVRASTEIAAILESLPDRKQVAVRAIQDRSILENTFCKITALSPNDRRIEAFIGSIAAQLAKEGKSRRRAIELTPNQACVALLVETPFCVAVLGADLEEKPGKGWTHVVEKSIAYGKAKPAFLIKVPHHGSSNAHCDEVWKNLVQPPIAVLATYNRGKKVPAPDDVKRILNSTDSAFACSSFNTVRAPKEHEVDKFLKILSVRRFRRFPDHGHIRVRMTKDENPSVQLFGEAVHLSEVH